MCCRDEQELFDRRGLLQRTSRLFGTEEETVVKKVSMQVLTQRYDWKSLATGSWATSPEGMVSSLPTTASGETAATSRPSGTTAGMTGEQELVRPSVALLLEDPRGLDPDAVDTVGLIAFSSEDDADEACDLWCCARYLGCAYTLGEGGLKLQAPDAANGARESFTNAETAYLACRLWQFADEMSELSAAEARDISVRLAGREDRTYAGFGGPWQAMMAVLGAKFMPGTPLAEALLRTEDAFLLQHRGEPVDEDEDWERRLWSDNHDGTGSNWLGLQLMLIRDVLSGETQWTSYVESLLDPGTGRAWSAGSGAQWQEAVTVASQALRTLLRSGAQPPAAPREDSETGTAGPAARAAAEQAGSRPARRGDAAVRSAEPRPPTPTPPASPSGGAARGAQGRPLGSFGPARARRTGRPPALQTSGSLDSSVSPPRSPGGTTSPMGTVMRVTSQTMALGSSAALASHKGQRSRSPSTGSSQPASPTSTRGRGGPWQTSAAERAAARRGGSAEAHRGAPKEAAAVGGAELSGDRAGEEGFGGASGSSSGAPAPERRSGEAPGDGDDLIVVAINKVAGALLGIDYQALPRGVVVAHVKDGLVSAWNTLNPGSKVSRGDLLVQVNSVKGSGQDLLAEIKKGGELALTFVRGGGERSLAHKDGEASSPSAAAAGQPLGPASPHSPHSPSAAAADEQRQLTELVLGDIAYAEDVVYRGDWVAFADGGIDVSVDFEPMVQLVGDVTDLELPELVDKLHGVATPDSRVTLRSMMEIIRKNALRSEPGIEKFMRMAGHGNHVIDEDMCRTGLSEVLQQTLMPRETEPPEWWDQIAKAATENIRGLVDMAIWMEAYGKAARIARLLRWMGL